MEIVKTQSHLPASIDDLAKFVLIGRDKLAMVRASIKRLDKLDAPKEVMQKKQQEAQVLEEQLLNAKTKISEISTKPNVCVKCKKQIQPKFSKRIKYCSRECRFSLSINCQVCGKEFKGRTGQKNCSKACGQKKFGDKYRPILKEKKPVHKINCKFCSSPFSSIRPKAKYCNQECARLAHNKMRRQTDIVSQKYLFDRDKYTCIYCGSSSIEDGVKIAADHVVPLVVGGENEINNIVTCCKSCNSSKGGRRLSPDVEERILSIIAKRNQELTAEQRFGLGQCIKLLLSRAKSDGRIQ